MVQADGDVMGNQPNDSLCNRRLHGFGFFEPFSGRSPSSEPPGRIRLEHRGDRVDNKAASDLVDYALGQLGGRNSKLGSTYNILTEAMINTYEHAGEDAEGKRQTWLAGVYYESSTERACFTVVDLGIGIIRSTNLRQELAFVGRAIRDSFWPMMDQGAKLRALLRREIPSRTGESHRGRGLPGMRRECKEARIRNLRIFSNRAFADVEADRFEQLRNDFRGTIIYREVE